LFPLDGIIPRRKVELASIQTLRHEVDSSSSPGKRVLFADFLFSGCIGLRGRLSVQILQFPKIANFPSFKIDIRIEDAACELLAAHSDMLRDYSSISFTNGVINKMAIFLRCRNPPSLQLGRWIPMPWWNH
jgi:hypothetical protein